MANLLLPLNSTIRLLIYDHVFPNKVTLYITDRSTADPNRFPDMTTIRSLRLVCRTIKGEVDHHYAVVARQHYVALTRAVEAHPFMVSPVAPDFPSAHTMTKCIALYDLRGLPKRHRYPALEKIRQFLPPFATEI
ncbi:hypothetical protein E8E11_008064 [Didymella keratinophila]|nr:hypothetical protein E8E11_008064 [Didymella keratinophila]